MTTDEAAKRYEMEHQSIWRDKGWAVHNPNNLPESELPTIFGFNNGGSPGFMCACLISEDGEGLGSHICSSEGYMPADLGILEGSRPDRHETFREHYPNGYKMEFLSREQARTDTRLREAIKKNQEKYEKAP